MCPTILSQNPSRPAPERFKLGKTDLHVWQTSVNLPVRFVEVLESILSDAEMVRANRFVAYNDRQRFIVAHCFLRTILASYLHSRPEDLQFQENPYGKPALLNCVGEERIHFNLSHSNDFVLVAINNRDEVGVDVEYIREIDVEEIATRFFSTLEVEKLRAMPTDMRRTAFFHCWTRKEAYIKARGEGLSLPLDQFSVSVGPYEPSYALEIKTITGELPKYSLFDLSPGENYVGAVAIQGFAWNLQHWQTPFVPDEFYVY